MGPKRKLKRSPASRPLQHCRSCGSECKSLCHSRALVANHCTLNRDLMRCVLAPASCTSSLAERSRSPSRRSHGGFNSTWPHRRSDLDSRLFPALRKSHIMSECAPLKPFFLHLLAILQFFHSLPCVLSLRVTTEAIRYTSAPLPFFSTYIFPSLAAGQLISSS